MSEAQKLLIERCARTCERRMELAAALAGRGHHVEADEHLRVAATASDLAFFLATVEVVAL